MTLADGGGAGEASADEAASWVAARAHWCYEFAVAMVARSVGEASAHTYVGNAALVIVGIMTALVAWYVFREIADIGFRVLRVVLAVGVVIVMLAWLSDLFRFVHPTEESRRTAEETVRRTATSAANHTSSWLFGKLKGSTTNSWWIF